jgi:O-antigen ligase
MNKFLTHYQSAIGSLNYVAFILLVMSLAFPWSFSQPLFAIWLIAWLLEGRWLSRKNLRFDKTTVPVLLLCGFVVWEAISLLWTQDLSSGLSELARHLPVFALLLISLFGGNAHYKSYRIKTALMAGSLMAVVSYCVVVYWHAHTGTLHRQWPEFSYWTLFGEGPVHYLKHRLYLCLVLLLAVFYSGDVYRHYITRYRKCPTMTLVVIADAILLTAICLSGSRTSIMLLPVLGLMYLYIQSPKKYRWYILSGFIVLVVTGATVLMRYNWRFQSMQEDLEVLAKRPDSLSNIKEPRVYIWSTVIRHADEYGVVGLGAGSSDSFLERCYEQDHYLQSFGSHNNYLYVWMDFGYIGLVYLLIALAAIPFFHTGRARYDAAFACVIFGGGMFTENLLTMMSSLYILYALIALIQMEQREEDSLPPVRP